MTCTHKKNSYIKNLLFKKKKGKEEPQEFYAQVINKLCTELFTGRIRLYYIILLTTIELLDIIYKKEVNICGIQMITIT